MRNPFVVESGTYKTTYRNDMKLFRTKGKMLRRGIIILLVLLLPMFASTYYVGLLTLYAIASIGGIDLNILTGFTGQISIGVGAFLGVGGYTAAILTSTVGLNFWFALPLAGVATAVVGGVFGIPSLRLKGLYLAIATLAAQVVILFIISRWTSLTNGTAGMTISRPSIGGFSFNSNMSYYYLTVIILMFTTLYATNLIRSTKWIVQKSGIIMKVGGAIMILIGIVLFTGQMPRISGFLLDLVQDTWLAKLG